MSCDEELRAALRLSKEISLLCPEVPKTEHGFEATALPLESGFWAVRRYVRVFEHRGASCSCGFVRNGALTSMSIFLRMPETMVHAYLSG